MDTAALTTTGTLVDCVDCGQCYTRNLDGTCDACRADLAVIAALHDAGDFAGLAAFKATLPPSALLA